MLSKLLQAFLWLLTKLGVSVSPDDSGPTKPS